MLAHHYAPDAGPLPDPFAFEPRTGDFTTLTGKTATSPSERTGLYLVIGDSLSCNTSTTAYAPASGKVEQVNIYDRAAYEVADPMLGVSLSGGSIWSRLGDELIDRDYLDRIIFVNCAGGGLSSSDFVPTGSQSQRLRAALFCTRLLAMPVTAVLYGHGTNDSAGDQWSQCFASILAFVRGHNVKAPFMVMKATWQGSAINSDIRTAMDDVVDGIDVLAGPDIDPPVIGLSERESDGIHPNGAGQDHAASLWADCIEADL
jgi:hypothetical protein